MDNPIETAQESTVAGLPEEGKAPTESAMPKSEDKDLTQQTLQQVRQLREKFMEVVRNGIENHMHVNFLREDPERNKLIDKIYLAYLHPDRIAGSSLDEVKEMLAQAEKLAALANVMEGKTERSVAYCTLDQYLLGVSETEKEKKKIEYYFSEASISDDLIKRCKRAYEMGNNPGIVGGADNYRGVGRGCLSPVEVAELCRQVGLPKDRAIIAVAVAMGESGLNPGSHNPNGEDSRGLWQINVSPSANPKYASWDLYDPLTNARAMFEKSSGGQNWQPWTVYTRGIYQNHLSAAQQAVEQVYG